MPVRVEIPILTQDEKDFLSKFEKKAGRIYFGYITAGLSLLLATIGLILGLKTDRQEGFLIAIIFSGLSINLYAVFRSYQRLYQIITKMSEYINEGHAGTRGVGLLTPDKTIRE